MKNKSNNTSSTGFLIRLYWMIIGNFTTILLAVQIAANNPKSIMLFNVFYLLNTICLVILRYIDIRYLNGLTIESEPATIKDWKKYSVKLIIFSLVLWIIVYFTKGYMSTYLGTNK
ncbi:MAG: hypothetical protein AB1498_04780 [bacterium]